jgi:hypothetical protein
MTPDEQAAHDAIDDEIRRQRAWGASLGDKCPLWLSAMGEADWEAERALTLPPYPPYAKREKRSA